MRRFAFQLSRFALPLFLVLAAASAALRAAEDDRFSTLRDEATTLQQVVDSTKDPGEKARLQDKLKRLKEELKVLEQRQALEARQRELEAGRTGTALEMLAEKLRLVYFTVDEGEAKVKELAARRQQAVADLDVIQAEMDGLSDQDAARRIELKDRLIAKNEELRALALEREAAEAGIELARDADHLREELKTAGEAAAHPTLRALFQAFTRARSSHKAGDRFAPLVTDAEQDLSITGQSLAISRNELAAYDQEMALLQKQTSFFRRDAKIERLLAEQGSQKGALNDRLPYLARQVDALKRRVEVLRTRGELAALGARFQDEEFQVLESTYLRRLRWPAAAILILVAIYFVSSYAILPVFRKNEALFLARRTAQYVLGAGTAIVLLTFLFDDLSMVAATLGIVSAALVISLQDVCTSVFGWFVIVSGSKFRIGDRLEIDGARGDVLDIQLLRTTLLEINGWLGVDQPTGRVVFMPNNFIFKSKVFNFTHGHPFIWGKVDVTISYSTPVASALTLFQRVLEEETRDSFEQARKAASYMHRRYGVEDADYRPKIYTHIADSGVALTLFFVAHYRGFSVLRNRLNRRLILEIETHPEIQLAYQTVQILQGPSTAGVPSAILGREDAPPPLPAGNGVRPPG